MHNVQPPGRPGQKTKVSRPQEEKPSVQQQKTGFLGWVHNVAVNVGSGVVRAGGTVIGGLKNVLSKNETPIQERSLDQPKGKTKLDTLLNKKGQLINERKELLDTLIKEGYLKFDEKKKVYLPTNVDSEIRSRLPVLFNEVRDASQIGSFKEEVIDPLLKDNIEVKYQHKDGGEKTFKGNKADYLFALIEDYIAALKSDYQKPGKKDLFKQVDSLEKRFKDLKTEFKNNPEKLFSELSTYQAGKLTLGSIVDNISGKDDAFKEIIGNLKDSASQYFWDVANSQLKNDTVYMDHARRVEEIEAILFAANDSIADEEGLSDKFMERTEKFEKLYDQENNWLLKACGQKQEEIFRTFLNELAENDSEYKNAQKVIQDRMAKFEGKEFNFVKVYKEDIEFRNAYDTAASRMNGIAKMLGYKFPTSQTEQLSLFDHFELAFKEELPKMLTDMKKEVVDHPGRYVYTPATVLATVAAGPIALGYIAGSVFTYHVAKKAVPTIQEELTRSGFFYDVRQARMDRSERIPYLGKIYSKEVTMESRIKHLEQLNNKGLLFTEDLEGLNDDIKKAIEDKKLFTKLPSLESIKSQRKNYLKVLHDVRSTPDPKGKLEALKSMHKAGILYRQDLDIEGVWETDVQNPFITFLNEENGNTKGLENLFDVRTESKIRNNNLFVAQGVLATQEEKINTLVQLYEKGLLFKEDLLTLAREDPELKIAFETRAQAKGIDLEQLPSTSNKYLTEESLKKTHDELRAKLLNVEGNKDDKGKPTLEGLKALYKNGLCFRQDVDGVDENLKKEFLVYIGKFWYQNSYEGLDDRDTFYDYGFAKRTAKVGEAMLNVIKRGGSAIYNKPAYVVYGPLAGVKKAFIVGSEALEETFGTFTDVKTKALSSRVAKALPSDKRVKEHANWITNKAIGTAKWALIGAAISTAIAGIFGTKIGAIVGGIFGFCMTNGRVSQIPKGGFIRAIKFSAKGALLGALVPVVLATIFAGLAIAGAVAVGTAITVASAGFGLIIPLIMFGVWAGWQLAGLTGKDEPITDPVEALKYEQPELEQGFFAGVPMEV